MTGIVLSATSAEHWRKHLDDPINPHYSRMPPDTLTRALSHRRSEAHFSIPSPGYPLLFPMQRVTGERQGEGAAASHETSA